MKPFFLAAVLLAVNPFSQSVAQNAEKASVEMVRAEVRKVDKEAGKVTLKHEEIKSLQMPPMTMVFRVKDATLWDNLTEGAKVYVAVEKAALLGYTVTKVEPAEKSSQ